MSDCSIDAIKIAKAIQKDELSILHGKEFKFRVKIKKRKHMKKTKRKNKYTLNQLGMTVDKLGRRVDQIALTVDKLEKRVDQIALTVDKLVVTVATLAKTVDDGFKRIDTRLDYIVKANNLKDLPRTK